MSPIRVHAWLTIGEVSSPGRVQQTVNSQWRRSARRGATVVGAGAIVLGATLLGVGL